MIRISSFTVATSKQVGLDVKEGDKAPISLCDSILLNNRRPLILKLKTFKCEAQGFSTS